MAHKFRNLALESYAYREGKHAYNNQEEKTEAKSADEPATEERKREFWWGYPIGRPGSTQNLSTPLLNPNS
jgi:hypothetical protein